MKLIDKDKIVAELERRMNSIRMAFSMQGTLHGHDRAYANAQYDAFNSLLPFLNTLEVKDVDLEKEIDREIETRWRGEYLFTSKFRESAKHFFELGLKAREEA